MIGQYIHLYRRVERNFKLVGLNDLINGKLKQLFCAFTLVMILLFLSSCGNAGKDGEHINYFKSKVRYSGKEIDLGLAEDEKAFDILEEKDGYRLLVGTPISDEEPFPMEDGNELWFLGGNIHQTDYRFLKADFSLSDKEPTPTDGYMISVEKSNGILYEFRGKPYIKTPDGYDDGSRYAEFLDGMLYADGKELWTISSVWSESFALNQGPTTVIDDGNAVYQYLLRQQRIYINGYRIPIAGDISIAYGEADKRRICGIMRLGDTVYALLRDTSECSLLVPLSPDMEEITKKGIELKANANGMCTSDGETGFFMADTALYITDGKDCRVLADLARYGMSAAAEIRRILPLADGRILVLGGNKIVMLSPEEENRGKSLITLGAIRTYNNDDLKQKVDRYNRVSDKCAVTIREFNTPADLNKAFLSGEIELIASNDQLLLRNYANKGLLLDLEEVMPGLFEEGVLYQNLIDALRVEGKSYYLPRTFKLYGYQMKTSEYPEEGFRTMDDLFKFVDEKDSEYKKRIERSVAFDFYGLRLDEWINWSNHTARFDDGDFEVLLTFCGSFLDRDTVEAYINANRNYTAKMSQITVENTGIFSDIDKGSGMTYFWLPSRVHQGPEIYAPYFIGIAKDEEFADDAMDFMDFVFCRDIAESCLSSDMGLKLIKDGKDAEIIWGFSVNTEENHVITGYQENKPTPAAELIEEWIRSADEYRYWGNELLDILKEEADRYFSGDITAKQAAEYVQNRMQLYLDEQG